MNIETIIKLNRFVARGYQLPILDAIENKGYKRVIAILPRRAGKDVTALQLCIRQCLKKPCVVYYVFPTYSQAKKVIWDSINNDGQRILDYIPDEVISSKNSQEMKIRFINGSLFQLVGSDNYDSLMGTNPQGVVFSEYALQDPRAYQYVRPILTANQGWAIFISTPRGKNHLWELYNIAKENPESWFAYKLTVEDTGHIPLYEIEKEKAEGIMSDDLIQQEYYCFPAGQQVLTNLGCKPIELICPNEMVISHTGRPRKVIDVISRHYAGQLVEIESFGSGESIVCTPNHPLRVYNQSTQSYTWKEAQYITEEDRLVFPKMTLGNHRIISYELCMLLAWYITEGSCFNNGVQFTVKKEESFIIGKYLTALEIPWNSYDNESTTNVVANSVQLVDLFKKNCGLLANDKKIPFDLIATHEEDFFHELIKGDGCYSLSGSYEKYCFTTVSRTLAYQLQILANSLNLGYAAGITVRDAYDGNILGRDVNCQKSYQINISFPTLRSNTWLIRAKNCIAAKVKSINRTHFEGTVYNLKVQYDESYIVAGRAVHNCSFDLGVEGAYYAKYLDKMRLKGQIGDVPWEPGIKVNTAWDIGVRDNTSIIFFQIAGQTIRIIDCYEKNKEGLEHYVSVLQSKPYVYGKHIAPHDIRVREFSTGLTRFEKARQLGINFTLASDLLIPDGIEAVRSTLPKVWIDEKACASLIKSLENYRQEFDAKKKVYKPQPLHDQYSHFADAMRYLCVSLPKTRDGLTPDELDKRYKEAFYGSNAHLPSVFRDDLPAY